MPEPDSRYILPIPHSHSHGQSILAHRLPLPLSSSLFFSFFSSSLLSSYPNYLSPFVYIQFSSLFLLTPLSFPSFLPSLLFLSPTPSHPLTFSPSLLFSPSLSFISLPYLEPLLLLILRPSTETLQPLFTSHSSLHCIAFFFHSILFPDSPRFFVLFCFSTLYSLAPHFLFIVTSRSSNPIAHTITAFLIFSACACCLPCALPSDFFIQPDLGQE